MIDIFSSYNMHLHGEQSYRKLDPHLQNLYQQPYQYVHPLVKQLPTSTPGIYSIGGGRQIGKTTLLKLWVEKLIINGTNPQSIRFLTGELITNFESLVNLIMEFIAQHPNSLSFLIIDEITYVNEWDRAIKFCADAGYLKHCIVVLTGSDLTLMQAARMTFPGRRGKADTVDFHVYPLSFREFLQLKNSVSDLNDYLNDNDYLHSESIKLLYSELQNYLIHGGYLTAINDMARDNTIQKATFMTYSDWIRGDMLKRGKQEAYLREILTAIIKRYNKQVSWHAITDAISIDSHKTVSEYCELLALMDALFIQPALLLDKLVAAPKKARKLTFTDPFIYHAINNWLEPKIDYFKNITDQLHDPHTAADLVESVVSNHYRRFYPTYYIKSAGEIDVAYVTEKKAWPIEIKWRNQLRPKDVSYIKKFANAKIYSKCYDYHEIEGITITPLPIALLRIDQSQSIIEPF